MSDDAWVNPSEAALLDKRVNSWIIQYEHLFDLCPAGKSFRLPLTVGKLTTIRSLVSRTFNKGSKKFRVVKHPDYYEVYRKE